MTDNDSLPPPEPGRRVDRLDGNAAGGPLSEIFGGDLTDALIECRHCGLACVVAETVVEIDPDGLVVICRGCRHQLLTYVWAGPARTLRFPGLLGLTMPSGLPDA